MHFSLMHTIADNCFRKARDKVFAENPAPEERVEPQESDQSAGVHPDPNCGRLLSRQSQPSLNDKARPGPRPSSP